MIYIRQTVVVVFVHFAARGTLTHVATLLQRWNGLEKIMSDVGSSSENHNSSSRPVARRRTPFAARPTNTIYYEASVVIVYSHVDTIENASTLSS